MRNSPEILPLQNYWLTAKMAIFYPVLQVNNATFASTS
jgi:hypothetical protein